ncbi:MAG: tetratricopeptide repeat protein [Myxococcales bacterium]|nr:tetratricopeptide repeat protein [Myxococcales bacterium]MCB9643226.1 tetratricopeptide repeat protein [Myxococcales bacterium]
MSLLRSALFGLGLLLSSGNAFAKSPVPTKPQGTTAQTPPKALFQQANQLYNTQQYAESIAILEQLQKERKINNFAIHYNLGNAYFRLRRYGHALAAYRRAQRLRPNQEDLLHNIQLIYQRTGHSEPDAAWRMRALFWYHLFTLRQLFWLTFGFLALSCLLWGAYLQRSARGLKGMRWWAASASLVACLLLGSLTTKFYQEQLVTTGIITANKITVRSGYGENFEALFTLQEADEVTVRERTAGWLRIETTQEDGKKQKTLRSGWVPDRALTTL